MPDTPYLNTFWLHEGVYMFEKIKRYFLYHHYHHYWHKIDKLQKKYNVCDISIIDSNWCCRRDKHKLENNGCCWGCNHKDIKTGKCKAKSLTCKMWVCKPVIKELKDAEESFNYIAFVDKRMRELEIPFYFNADYRETFAQKPTKGLIRTDMKEWYLDNVFYASDPETDYIEKEGGNPVRADR